MKITIEDAVDGLEVRSEEKTSAAELVGTLMMAIFGILGDSQTSTVNMIDLERATIKILHKLSQGKLEQYVEELNEEKGGGNGKEKI